MEAKEEEEDYLIMSSYTLDKRKENMVIFSFFHTLMNMHSSQSVLLLTVFSVLEDSLKKSEAAMIQ